MLIAYINSRGSMIIECSRDVTPKSVKLSSHIVQKVITLCEQRLNKTLRGETIMETTQTSISKVTLSKNGVQKPETRAL